MKHIVSSFIFFIITFLLSSVLFCQVPYTITPSHDTTIATHGGGKFNTIIVDNSKNDKDVNLVVETIYTCPYTIDGVFFGIRSQAIGWHINKSYNLHIAAHTTSQNTQLYREQPDISFLRDENCFAVGIFDADVIVKDSETVLLREHLHTDIPINISTDGKYGGGMYLISQAGSTECVPAFILNNGQADITISSIGHLDSDSEYTFSNILALPVTISPGSQIKLFDICYSPSSTSFYSRRLEINFDNGNTNIIMIGGTPCGISAPSYMWQTQSAVLEQPAPQTLEIFPNPASSSFKIITSLSHAHLEIIDVLGKTIRSEQIGEHFTWEDKAAPGVYYIRVKGLNTDQKIISNMKKVILTN